MAFEISYSPDAEGHLELFTKRQQKIVLDAVEDQLSHEPIKATRNRKLMRPNPLATWQLRIGDFRVYYDVAEEAQAVVLIRAIGIKVRNCVYIGGKKVEL